MNDTDDIRIADAYENNLKHVSLTIPKGKLVVFAGVSGSGKSSLAFVQLPRQHTGCKNQSCKSCLNI